jgi:hypothetical protein
MDLPGVRDQREDQQPDVVAGRKVAGLGGRLGDRVGQVGDTFGPDGPTCELTKRLVIPGGSKPDWGPARP